MNIPRWLYVDTFAEGETVHEMVCANCWAEAQNGRPGGPAVVCLGAGGES